MYEVERGIEMPVIRQSAKYPFKDLAVGDSFFVPEAELVNSKRMHSTAYNYGKRYGRKFVARRVEGGVRVWRQE
jgi:hypothetical protein